MHAFSLYVATLLVALTYGQQVEDNVSLQARDTSEIVPASPRGSKGSAAAFQHEIEAEENPVVMDAHDQIFENAYLAVPELLAHGYDFRDVVQVYTQYGIGPAGNFQLQGLHTVLACNQKHGCNAVHGRSGGQIAVDEIENPWTQSEAESGGEDEHDMTSKAEESDVASNSHSAENPFAASAKGKAATVPDGNSAKRLSGSPRHSNTNPFTAAGDDDDTGASDQYSTTNPFAASGVHNAIRPRAIPDTDKLSQTVVPRIVQDKETDLPSYVKTLKTQKIHDAATRVMEARSKALNLLKRKAGLSMYDHEVRIMNIRRLSTLVSRSANNFVYQFRAMKEDPKHESGNAGHDDKTVDDGPEYHINVGDKGDVWAEPSDPRLPWPKHDRELSWTQAFPRRQPKSVLKNILNPLSRRPIAQPNLPSEEMDSPRVYRGPPRERVWSDEVMAKLPLGTYPEKPIPEWQRVANEIYNNALKEQTPEEETRGPTQDDSPGTSNALPEAFPNQGPAYGIKPGRIGAGGESTPERLRPEQSTNGIAAGRIDDGGRSIPPQSQLNHPAYGIRPGRIGDDGTIQQRPQLEQSAHDISSEQFAGGGTSLPQQPKLGPPVYGTRPGRISGEANTLPQQPQSQGSFGGIRSARTEDSPSSIPQNGVPAYGTRSGRIDDGASTAPQQVPPHNAYGGGNIRSGRIGDEGGTLPQQAPPQSAYGGGNIRSGRIGDEGSTLPQNAPQYNAFGGGNIRPGRIGE